MRVAAAACALLLLAAPAPAPGQTPEAAYTAELAARSAALTAHLLQRAVERLELHRRREAEGREGDRAAPERSRRLTPLDAALLIRSGAALTDGNRLLREEAAAPFRMGMFHLHDIVAALLFAGEGVEPATREAIRESLRDQPLYRGDTENHWVLYHTGLYLAAGLWPDEPGTSWFNGRSSAENERDALAFLRHWARRTITEGQGEFDSPNYLGTFLAPLLTLEAFAPDAEVQALADALLQWLLADYAVESLRGLYAGGHSRDYPEHATRPGRAPNVGWGWLYFGEGPGPLASEYVEVAALSAWRPPAILRDIATDREAPYEHRERKRVRDVIRYGPRRSPALHKTTWMTSSYALGSLEGGVLQPIQQHTWDVTFPDDQGGGSIFTLHPYYSGRELAMFFPEEPEWLTDQVNRFHTTYTDPGKWVSSSPWERVLQHRNALIVLYDVPDTARHGHIDGHLPKSLLRREEAGGWIFAQGGDAYVALRVLRPYEWVEEPGAWRLRSPHRRNAVVLEAAETSEYASFEAFRERILGTRVEAGFDGPVRARYITAAGDTLDFTFPDRRLVNGRPLRPPAALFDGPRVRGGAGRLLLSHGGRTVAVEPRP